ncbi:hypothetical protein BB561_004372 [Smittium simulii]|uniref:Uncharacterized protein n=1 Tax=Smittium simulii TaxID=133385 RepID=A0A2T9YGJ1_9FUNG|nr:hypothetical protein BB561_004372 [Smittium simulii]
MKYTPPVLNSTNPQHNHKKDDAMLVDLQAKVANMTRPVDFMIHKCIQDGVTQIPVDQVIGFTNNIRLMLSDLASHMTQLRIERVQMHANNNKRTPHIERDSVDMLLDQDTYNIISKQKIKPKGKPYRWFKPKLSQWNFGAQQNNYPQQQQQGHNMVPRCSANELPRTIENNSVRSNPRQNKRKIAVNQKQRLTTEAINNIQSRFLNWKNDPLYVEKITDSEVVNFLAEIMISNNLFLSTILTYQSSIFDLINNSKYISNNICFKMFIDSVKRMKMRVVPDIHIDISPIIHLFRDWGANSTLDNERLTRKTCWLLSVNGFLRPSDICFIDLNNSKIINGALRLYIAAPKEKRGSQSITKTCTIGPHDEPLLCPVEAFKAYIAKKAVLPCNSAHPSREELSINYLVRSLENNSKQIGAQRIGKHVNSISVLIPGFANTIRPKGRAIGFTLATQSGVPLDEIVTHGNWFSLQMFDSYYRLSRGSNKLTKAIMTLDSHNANLCSYNIIYSS